MVKRTIEERFWSKVNKNGSILPGMDSPCWVWMAGRNKQGYGVFRISGSARVSGQVRAHRYSYELHYGTIPKGVFVCHSCDNPSCINPNHLWLGTPANNMDDKKAKGHDKWKSYRIDYKDERPKIDKNIQDKERFWAKVNKDGPTMPHMTTPCWEWMGSKVRGGYGQFHCRRMLKAHRFSYELHYGTIQEGVIVLHQCDNPACVNPSHLSVGTNADNMADRDAKNRQAKGERQGWYTHPENRPKGERNPNVKLTEPSIIEILTIWDSVADKKGLAKQLAIKFEVSRDTIDSIVHRKSWTHI